MRREQWKVLADTITDEEIDKQIDVIAGQIAYVVAFAIKHNATKTVVEIELVAKNLVKKIMKILDK